MQDKFKGRYRIPSARRPDWNYSSDGAYFVTIYTKNRINYFGRLLNASMQLSEIGKIAYNNWIQIPRHSPYAIIDEFVIMPDHIHGIIFIITTVETLHATSLQERILNYQRMSEISPKPGSLPTIMRSYKSAVTKQARKININFSWQPRYHDRVIRNWDEYQLIKNYILDNPENY